VGREAEQLCINVGMASPYLHTSERSMVNGDSCSIEGERHISYVSIIHTGNEKDLEYKQAMFT
jgi:hypothetical protein